MSAVLLLGAIDGVADELVETFCLLIATGLCLSMFRFLVSIRLWIVVTWEWWVFIIRRHLVSRRQEVEISSVDILHTEVEVLLSSLFTDLHTSEVEILSLSPPIVEFEVC